MEDVLIIGGGVIGLSLAWDLAKHGQRVQVVDRGAPGREASWAGAGIIPAAVQLAERHPYEQLRGLACKLQPRWAEELRGATGIDNGYRRCGAIHLARRAGEAAALAAWVADEREQGIEVRELSVEGVRELEPGLAAAGSKDSELSTEYLVPSTQNSALRAAFLVPGESQLRNPRHLQALLRACELAGVTVSSDVTITDVVAPSGRIAELQTTAGSMAAGQYCVTAGAWTSQILTQLGVSTPIVPIRGQMVLFRCEQPPLQRIVNEGSRYLVPREDGHVLVGSTEEEAGFDKRTTPEVIDDLTEFAKSLVPALADAAIEKTWSGLRPCALDGLPYLGRLPGLENAYVAAGHFRSGLYLSAATAVVMSQLLRAEEPEIDLTPFRVGR